MIFCPFFKKLEIAVDRATWIKSLLAGDPDDSSPATVLHNEGTRNILGDNLQEFSISCSLILTCTAHDLTLDPRSPSVGPCCVHIAGFKGLFM